MAGAQPRPQLQQPILHRAEATQQANAKLANAQSPTAHAVSDSKVVQTIASQPSAPATTKQHYDDIEPKWTDIVVAAAAFGSLIFTAALWYSTRNLWIETKRLAVGAERQSEDMGRSIAEASRAASAMENVARSIGSNVVTTNRIAEDQRRFWALQMRAYTVVLVGGATYQDDEKGFRFEGKPVAVNVGNTPAYKFRSRIKAEVVETPLPDDFSFELPPAPSIGRNTIGPRQEVILSSIIDEVFPAEDIEAIKTGAKGQALCVWGTIDYEDMAGTPHFTNFCQLLTWQAGGRIMGYYHKSHNDSD